MFIIIHYTISINCRDQTTKITYLLDGEFIRNQLRRCNVPPNHRPACSSISQHTATPELGMIPPRIRVNAGLHITEGIQSANQTLLGLTGLQQSAKQAQSKDQPLHTRSKTIPSQSCEERKTTGDSPKRKVRHNSSLQGNSELFLALSWPKQLSCNPNQGISTAQTRKE